MDDSTRMNNSRIFNDYPTIEGVALSLGSSDPSAESHTAEDRSSQKSPPKKAISQPTSLAQAKAPPPAGSTSRDIVVKAPVGAALRYQLNNTHAVAEASFKLISFIDPACVWAPLIINILQETDGQSTERWAVIDSQTQRTLASIHETCVNIASADTARVSYVHLGATDPGSSDLLAALIERSHMTTVFIDQLQAGEINVLLAALMAASSRSTWRCPTLLFMLPAEATSIRRQILDMAWRQPLQVLIDQAPVSSPSAAWGAIVAQWRLAQAHQARICDRLGVPRVEAACNSFSLHLPAVDPPPRMIVTAELAGSARRAKPILT